MGLCTTWITGGDAGASRAAVHAVALDDPDGAVRGAVASATTQLSERRIQPVNADCSPMNAH
jgi:hypothetical protein